jgi:two-component system NtrC family sensor kinase
MASWEWPQQQIVGWQQWLDLARKAGLRIGLWDWDVKANSMTWSDETYRQYGLTRDMFSGRIEDTIATIHPEDRARVERAIQKVVMGGTEYAEKYRIVRPDETICWIETFGVVVRSDSATHLLGMEIDVTNLKNAQQAGRDSEEKYLLLLNSTAEGIYGLDLEGNCTFCNPSCLRLLGYPAPEDLLGKNMHALVHHTLADGTPYHEEKCQISVGLRERTAIYLADEVLWRADESHFRAEYRSYPMYKNGTFVGSVVTFFDISERKRAEQAQRESEEKYRELVENATYGIFRSNGEGDFLVVNPALVAMLGYSSKSELMTCNLNTDIYQNPADLLSMLEMFGTRERISGTRVNWKRKDGKTVSVRISGRQVHGKDGRVTHFELIAEDITEWLSIEKQLLHAQKMEAVGLLAGGISHDFNNHLSVILGNVDLMVEKAPSGVLQHYAGQIKKAIERASQLTRQLLAFSRKQVLNPTLLDLNTVVSDVVGILRRLIGEDVQIVVEGETNLASIHADRGQVEQILMNLATNARDAMPTGGKFTLRTENVELGPDDVARDPHIRPGPYVRLSVSDTGAGMSEEVRSRVFEPFFTTKPLGKGTGLGLAAVYGIVNQNGGYIWISSEPGAGTTFDIYLPRGHGKASLLGDGLGTRSERPKGTETILVLEDEESLRAVFCEFLTAGGYRVLQAGRGDQAIQLAQEHKGSIHLMVSDVVLPDMTGPSVVERIRTLHPEISAFYVSGYSNIPAAQKIVEEGAILMQKPISRSDFMGTVDALLHLRTPSAMTSQSQ